MKNKNMLIILTVIISVVTVIIVVKPSSKENKNNTESNNNQTNTSTQETITTPPQNDKKSLPETAKGEQNGSAGSNISIKDNNVEARKQIELAMQKWAKDTYGNEVEEVKIKDIKVYTALEEKQNEALKEKNIGIDDVAFEVNYELKIANGVKDTMKFTAATGTYNEKTRWVTDKYNLGILRTDGNGYKITDFGTGW